MKYKIREDKYSKTLFFPGKKSEGAIELTNDVIVDFDKKGNIIMIEVLK